MITKKLTATVFILVFFANNAAAKETTYTTIFAHGLGGQVLEQRTAYNDFVGGTIIGENGPEWNIHIHGSDTGPQQSCLAQEADIEVIEKQMELHLQDKIILLGVSKGAATMLTTVGWLAIHTPSYLDNIQALILESPFACPETVTANIVYSSFKHFLGEYFGGFIGSILDTSCMPPVAKLLETKFYPNYKPNEITPIKAVMHMWKPVDKNMVIVFIHSEKDELISINDSRLLYRELKKLGFTNLYLIEASDGCHANVCWGPDKDAILKKLCLIYLKHHLPLPPLTNEYIDLLQNLYAEHGQRLLSEIQPSIEEVTQRLHPWLSWIGVV